MFREGDSDRESHQRHIKKVEKERKRTAKEIKDAKRALQEVQTKYEEYQGFETIKNDLLRMQKFLSKQGHTLGGSMDFSRPFPEMGECPHCNLQFPQGQFDNHVATCMHRPGAAKPRRSRPNPSRASQGRGQGKAEMYQAQQSSSTQSMAFRDSSLVPIPSSHDHVSLLNKMDHRNKTHNAPDSVEGGDNDSEEYDAEVKADWDT